MVELAKFYEEGQGVDKSDDEAFKLYKMATDAGFLPGWSLLTLNLLQCCSWEKRVVRHGNSVG
jgi:TPR repeat protein